MQEFRRISKGFEGSLKTFGEFLKNLKKFRKILHKDFERFCRKIFERLRRKIFARLRRKVYERFRRKILRDFATIPKDFQRALRGL